VFYLFLIVILVISTRYLISLEFQILIVIFLQIFYLSLIVVLVSFLFFYFINPGNLIGPDSWSKFAESRF
jgi:hypothetical protein